MASSRTRLTLGGRIANRRKQLGLSVAEAARRAEVDWKTWRNWERDTRIPDDRNHRLIEEFCGWEPGSVEDVIDGRNPTRRQVASVTELHPGISRSLPDDAAMLVAEWQDMGVPDALIPVLLDEYSADRTQLRERYRDIARRKAVGE